MSFTFSSRRSVVHSTKGIVTCSQPLAAQAGMEVLNKGGNAADAAVATAVALNITEPCSCGIGGDAFALFWDAKDKKVKGINGSGRSPAALTTSALRKAGIKGDSIPPHSAHAVTVPGAPAALVDLVDWWGSNKVDLQTVLHPAIKLAEDGYPVSEISSVQWKKQEGLLRSQSEHGRDMLRPDLKAPEEGEIMKLPFLAKSYASIAKDGKKGYYQGPIAEAIVDVLQRKGSLLTLDDLSSHTSEQVIPISYTCRTIKDKDGSAYTLSEIPPNGQGLTALMALGILDELQETGKVKLDRDSLNTEEALHAMIESLRLAFADTRSYVADPDASHVPVKQLLSREYLKSRAELFDMNKCCETVEKGTPVVTSDTVYLTTSDAEGNACSFIFSNYDGFGTGIIPAGCGFTLQNRGSNFTLKENHPNDIGEDPTKGKRPYHTIIPAMITKSDELFMAYGVMGGFMQAKLSVTLRKPQGHLQVLLNMLLFGANPQTALDSPRFCITPEFVDTEGILGKKGEFMGSQTYLEEGISDEVFKGLKKKGHDVKMLSGYAKLVFGKGQVIQLLKHAQEGRWSWAAGSDPRGDGQSIPQI